MEYQKIIDLLDNTSNQQFKFWTKNWVEINNDSRGNYNTNSQIKFKISTLKSHLCDHSDAYILVNGTIAITGNARPPVGRTEAQIEAPKEKNERNKRVILKNCTPFTDCISETNNTQIDYAKDTDVVMPM